MDLFENILRLAGDPQQIHPFLTPLLIGTATVLGMTSLRNSDIATRARNLPAEGLDAKTTVARLYTIRNQIWWFYVRYVVSSIACFLLAMSIVALSIFIVAPGKELQKYLLYSGLSGYLLSAGCLAFEFLSGFVTLHANSRSLTQPDHYQGGDRKAV